MPTRLSAVAPATAPALTPARLAGIADSFAARPELWRPQVRFDAQDRWHTRLEPAEETAEFAAYAEIAAYEVWLLTWLPGQGTDIHDHGGASGAFAVVEGVLTERSFRLRPPRTHTRQLRAGGTRSFGPRYIHEVANRGSVPAVSVHVYSPALAAMSYYRESADGRIALDRTDPVED